MPAFGVEFEAGRIGKSIPNYVGVAKVKLLSLNNSFKQILLPRQNNFDDILLFT